MDQRGRSEAWEWLKTILIAIILALLIRASLLEVFMVQGQSMLPTLHNRERLIVSKVQYHLRQPRRGEIVVFEAVGDRDFIKRVIGVAGDEVRADRWGVWVNGRLLDEGYVLEQARGEFGPVTVPPGTILVMGDNRNNSVDSRHPSIGFVPLELLKGKAMLVFWPLQDVRLMIHP